MENNGVEVNENWLRKQTFGMFPVETQLGVTNGYQQ